MKTHATARGMGKKYIVNIFSIFFFFSSKKKLKLIHQLVC